MEKAKYLTSILVALLIFASHHFASADEVGVVSAVNRDMDGTPPGSEQRALSLTDVVVQDELIQTSPIGSGQLLLADQTSLTIASNSNIVLDNYVYDPDQQAGEMTLSLIKGTLRFIGGRITKKRPAIVRTPTATIGVRGGLVLIEVDDNGRTRVVHLAGEYTTVEVHGDADSDGLDDGDTSPTGGLASRVTLSRSNATAIAETGSAKFVGLSTSADLAASFSSLEGRGTGGTDQANGVGIEERTGDLAQYNSEVPGGEFARPRSTTGEQSQTVQDDPAYRAETVQIGLSESASSSSQLETLLESTEITTETGGDDSVAAPPPPTGVALVAPTGGAAFSTSIGFVEFDTLTVGSLSGSAAGETLTLPIPNSSSELLTTHPTAAFLTPFAVEQNPNTGLFEFDQNTASSTGLGGLRGIGFSDFDNEFHFAAFNASSTPSGVFENGVVAFGTPTPGQAAAFPNDPGVAGANTVDVYMNEFGVDGGRGFLTAGPIALIPQTLSIVGNSGSDRFFSGDVIPSSRALSTTLLITQDDETGLREENFAVFAAPVYSLNGELQISGTGLVSFNSRSNDEYGAARLPFGTFEAADGATVFGANAEYLSLTSLHRNDARTLVTNDFGVEGTLTPTGTGFAETSSRFRASLFTRAPDEANVVLDPLALANDTTSRFGGTTGILDVGFAAGFAKCSTGNCGAQLDTTSGAFSGVYPLLGDGGFTTVQVDFADGVNELDTNAIGFNFTQKDFGLSNIQDAGASGDPPDSFVFGFDVDNSFEAVGAYIDDRNFVAGGESSFIIAGNEAPGAFALASNDAVGRFAASSIGVGFNDPENLRWGWWAAAFEPTDGTTGFERQDLVHLGTFVAGTRPNPSDVPFSGSASFAGLAAGTQADLSLGTTEAIGGNFTMNYDFGTGNGDLSLTLSNPLGIASTFDVPLTGAPDNTEYNGALTGTTEVQVFGAFFSGASGPISATAGNFDIRDQSANTHTIGIYGGDVR